MKRIAYLISAYKDAPHLKRLIDALDDGACDFYVHVDRKADDAPFRRLLEGRVMFVRRHWVSWGGWEQVAYQQEMLKAAVNSGNDYERVVCLSGQDYPLMPASEIRRFFARHPDTEFIMGENLTRSSRPELLRRIRCYHFFRDVPLRNLWLKNKLVVAARWLMRLLPVRKPATVRIDDTEADVYAGSDYWALTMACACHVCRVWREQPQVARYFRYSFVPSEMCVQTIVFHSSFASRVVPWDGTRGLHALTPLHYIEYQGAIKVMTLADWDVLQASGKMFSRKVVSGVSDALVEKLNHPMPAPAIQGRVSVVMCTYNGARFLREQLDSLLAQTRKADEIIVQDDGSTDDTWEILTTYAAAHPEIRLYRNEGERGVNHNFFSAMRRAGGDFIAISDQDDIWEPDKLERQLHAIGHRLLCAGLSRPFSSEGAAVRVDTRIPNYDLLRLLYIGGFSGHTILFRRRLLELMPRLDVISPLRYYDVILAMVAAAYESIAYIPQPLVNHRRYADAATYARPADNRLTPGNVWSNVVRTWRLYRELRPEMRRRLQGHYLFLSGLHSEAPALQDTLRMLSLQTGGGVLCFLRLQWFCVRHADRLFYTRLPRTWLTRLRAAYFPISCSEYFRYLTQSL